MQTNNMQWKLPHLQLSWVSRTTWKRDLLRQQLMPKLLYAFIASHLEKLTPRPDFSGSKCFQWHGGKGESDNSFSQRFESWNASCWILISTHLTTGDVKSEAGGIRTHSKKAFWGVWFDLMCLISQQMSFLEEAPNDTWVICHVQADSSVQLPAEVELRSQKDDHFWTWVNRVNWVNVNALLCLPFRKSPFSVTLLWEGFYELRHSIQFYGSNDHELCKEMVRNSTANNVQYLRNMSTAPSTPGPFAGHSTE